MSNSQLFPRLSVLVTGGAGFIGSNLVKELLDLGCKVTTLDNFDPFYDRRIKERNIIDHYDYEHYSLVEADIRDFDTLQKKLGGDYDVIVHLAARAGVRPSIENPVAYQKVNVEGTQNLLELAKLWGVKQFVFGSSSSVYGVNPSVPWKESDHVLRPISPYASTKISGELLGHVYSSLYGIRFLALRFFTVYGPRQRPDLAIHKFTRLMLDKKPIPVFGDGSTRRDYTFVKDIVHGIKSAMIYDKSLFEVINLGNCDTVSLAELIDTLEEVLGVSAIRDQKPDQPGDVPQTWADIQHANSLLGYKPERSLKEGLIEFCDWYKQNKRHSVVKTKIPVMKKSSSGWV